MGDVKGTYWMLTINNPTAEHRQALASPPELIKRAWYQDEIGESGTLHIQCSLNTTQCRFGAIKQIFPGAHIEKARNDMACINYVQKSKSAVPGTFKHFNRKMDGEVPPLEAIQPQSNNLVESLRLLFNALPFDFHTKQPESLYRECLSAIVSENADAIDRLTQQRVRTAFIMAFDGFLVNHLSYLEECPMDIPAEEGAEPWAECVIDKHHHKSGDWCCGCSECS